MPPPFQDLEFSSFERLLARFPFERAVTGIHLHHTWKPRRDQWQGHRTLRVMWYTDTLQRGWSDIAQHLTIAPDGTLWTGRDWNRPPCSSRGKNGSRRQGPFMITLVGDFNAGRDPFSGDQECRTVDVLQTLLKRFDFTPEQLELHRDLDADPDLQCPGSQIESAVLRQRIAIPRPSPETPLPQPPPVARPFGEEAEAWYQFIAISNRGYRTLRDEGPDEPPAGQFSVLGEGS